MTTTFTASNGIKLEITDDGGVFTHDSRAYVMASVTGVEALREYFQHERDRELGRWRDPDNRDLVVYRMPELDYDEGGRAVRVMDETSGEAVTYWENRRLDWENKEEREAADRYFKAHPEPRPWEEAEPGEIWELTEPEGLKQLWVKTDRELWRSIHLTKSVLYNGKNAADGRRIWPEED